MTRCWRLLVRSAVVLAVVLSGSTLLLAQEAEKPAAPAARVSPEIAKLQEAQGEFPVTVLPLILPGQPIELATRVEFAKGLAIALERTGMKSIEVSPDDFSVGSAAPGDLDAFAKGVTNYLKQHPAQTDYVYAMEYCGKQGSPATAILTVLADRKGNIVWKNRQAPGDSAFQQYQPADMLTGVMVSVDPFRRLLKLGDPNTKEAYKGRWSGYFEEKRKQQVPKKTSHEPRQTNYVAIGIASGLLIVVGVVIGVQRSKRK